MLSFAAMAGVDAKGEVSDGKRHQLLQTFAGAGDVYSLPIGGAVLHNGVCSALRHMQQISLLQYGRLEWRAWCQLLKRRSRRSAGLCAASAAGRSGSKFTPSHLLINEFYWAAVERALTF